MVRHEGNKGNREVCDLEFKPSMYSLLAQFLLRLSENAHLPFGRLTALSKVEGLRYPDPSSLRRTSMYASFLGISEALHMDIFHQSLRSRFFDSLFIGLNPKPHGKRALNP